MKFLLAGLFIYWAIFVIRNADTYTAKYDINYWQHEFSDSQVVKGDKAGHFFSDSELYAILGYKYVLGEDPTKLHPEVPPLGKQLIGLSVLIFKNPNLINLIAGFASLGILYLIAKEIFSNNLLSLTSVFIASLDSELLLQMKSSNLDVIQLLFISASIYFFLKKKFAFTWVFIGAIAVTKFYLNGLILGCVFILYLFLKSNFKRFIDFLKPAPLFFISYAFPYYATFLNNPSIIEFLRFQRWLTNWWAGNARVPLGGIWSIIYTGWWKTWWPGPPLIRVPEWNALWPANISLGLLSIFKFPRNVSKIHLLWLWVATYLLFLSTTSPFPRYLVAITPFSSILTVYLLNQLINKLSIFKKLPKSYFSIESDI